MPNVRSRSALAFTLLVALFGLTTGCTHLPFFKGVQAASPAPSTEASPGTEGEEQVIEGHVGNSAPATTATVHVTGSAFSPNQVTIATGGTVTFVNDDAVAHSVVPGSGAQFTATQTFSQGEQVTITFSQAGDQPYKCGLHPTMMGTVSVQTP